MTHDAYDPPDLTFRPTARGLFRLWRDEWRLASLGLLAALGVTITTLAIPWLVQRAIDHAIVPRHAHKLWPYLGGIAVLALIRLVVNYQRRYLTSRVGIKIENELRRRLFAAYLTYPRAFYDRHATGQVLSRATNDLYPVRYFIGWGVIQMCQSAMMIVGASIILLIVNPLLAICAGVAMPAVAYLTWRFAHLVTPISRVVQQRQADLTESADEGVVGIEMVQAFGREQDVRDRFGLRARAVRDGMLQEARVEATYLPLLLFVPTLAIAAVIGIGGHLVIQGDLTLGQFALFNTLLLQLAWPLEALGWIVNLGQRAIASAGRSFAWLDGIRSLPEPPTPTRLPTGPLSLRLSGVDFAYSPEHEVLREIDLELAPGEIVAVCGGTGAGKSSLLGLVARFYDPQQGHVAIGGVDLRELALGDLRAAVAVGTQRPVLFSAPLRDNLLAGRVDAAWDDVVAACDAAGVSAFLDQLPDGFDTLIGERGVNLSGGQRQRVALARALISEARVLVLDDPLSAVDTRTEASVLAHLREAAVGRTVLVAAQRLSTVEAADRVVVLVDGRIAEEGTTTSLAGKGGAFDALFGDEAVLV
ncbi:MAG: ATP-binding cassette, subfamily bacterial [Gaiellales bacterium]|nr:ATP-binding cassette, subfamily bacterial [Gaiellales bacterium]MDX6568936.1 ATP-binding cassette, subfamily bacterial [Gaiellales bacterium]